MEVQNSVPTATGSFSGQQTSPVITTKEWMLSILLMVIPIVNIVLLFVWAFGGGTNPSKANYAKAYLIWTAIFIVLGIISYSAVFAIFMTAFQSQM